MPPTVREPEPPLIVDTDGAVMMIQLDRPDALNAADERLHTELASIWGQLVLDEGFRAFVLTGNGRAFCAGGDFGILRRMNESATFREATLNEAGRTVRTMAAFPLPIIAAEGVASASSEHRAIVDRVAAGTGG